MEVVESILKISLEQVNDKKVKVDAGGMAKTMIQMVITIMLQMESIQ